jgi:hypothetical protein
MNTMVKHEYQMMNIRKMNNKAKQKHKIIRIKKIKHNGQTQLLRQWGSKRWAQGLNMNSKMMRTRKMKTKVEHK